MNQTGDTQEALVSCVWLAGHLDDPKVRVIEVSAANDDAKYRAGHIPGAAWWFWKDALWHATDREFITPEQLAQRLGSMGVSPTDTVVIYGDPIQFGTYAFWVLTMAGHKNLRLLDGGRKRWIAEGRPLSQKSPDSSPVAYTPGTVDFTSRVGRNDVRAKLGQPGRQLLDVRAPEEYRGERVSPPSGDLQFDFDHGAERTGRIPGATHLYFRVMVNEDDTFLSREKLEGILEQTGPAADGGTELVTYCRLSHRATLAWFAIKFLLGRENVLVYDGSWTEWGSIVGFPIEKD